MTDRNSSAVLEDLEQDEMLKLTAHIAENAKEATKSHRPAFYQKFLQLGNNLNRLSRHLDCRDLRKVYFHIAWMESPLRESLNHDLQNMLLASIDAEQVHTEKAHRQILRDAATSVTVNTLSDANGRDIIDIDQLIDDLDGVERMESDNAMLVQILSRLDEVYDDYVEDKSKMMISFYENIVAKCGEGTQIETDNPSKKWHPVLEEISEQTVELDRQAISWQRALKTDNEDNNGDISE